MNIDNFSLIELENLQSEIARKISERRETDRKKVLEEMKNLAASRGFNFNELIGSGKKPGASGSTKGIVRFRNPSDPSQTWVGRGPRPQWLRDAISNGAKQEDFAV